MSLDALLSSPTVQTVLEVLVTFLAHLRPYQGQAFKITTACTAVWTILQWLRTSRQKVRTTRLRGPPAENFLYGVGKRIRNAIDSGALYETWAQEYGPVYAVPSTLGTKGSCVIPKRSHIFMQRNCGHTFRPL